MKTFLLFHIFGFHYLISGPLCNFYFPGEALQTTHTNMTVERQIPNFDTEENELEQLVVPDEEQTSIDITPPQSQSNSSRKNTSIRSNPTDSNPTTGGVSWSSQTTSHSVPDCKLSSRLQQINEKPIRSPSERPPRPPPPTLRAFNKRDVTDVRQMEQGLLKLLEDFHSGKLRAFGKDCSMQQMTGIREQQEHLARLNFELGAQQELFAPLSDEGLRQGTENMHALMSSLEKLSISIEKLHSSSAQD